MSESRIDEDANTSAARERSEGLRQGSLPLSRVGELRLVWSPRGLVMLALPSRDADEIAADMVDRGIEPPPFDDVPTVYRELLQAYDAGAEVDPRDLPVDLRGTSFQIRVWNALRAIPRGSVRSYAGIAADVGSPRAMRAVGMANSANPIAIVVPCHRVVETGMRLGGYSGGLAMKRLLLSLEGVRVEAGKVIPGQLELWDRLKE
ncbi:MAG TPA: methylated-DNA--[protein]-cysteine S-methyltransferase [Polyangiales bacterium]